MGHRESKLDPRPIIVAHFATFVRSDGARSLRDYVEHIAFPILVAGATWLRQVSISATTGAALLTLAGLFAAFLFQLTVQLLDRAATWAETSPSSGRRTSQYATLLTELSANAAYASLASGVTATFALLVAVTDHGWSERVLTAATIGSVVHLATTLLLVVTRTFLLTVARLNAARTGTTDKATFD